MKPWIFVFALLSALTLDASPVRVEIEHHKPTNLFELAQPVRFNATVRGLPQSSGEATAVITDFFGQTKSFTIPVQASGKGAAQFVVDLGTPEPGYYDLKVTLAMKDAAGKTIEGDSTVYVPRQEGKDKKFQDTDPICFGVVRFVDRTAEQVRQGGYRFGLKVFQVGNPGVWWRRPLVYDVNEICDASRKLGLQWTRQGFNQGATTQPGVISTADLISKHQMNVVLKVEGFPESCYDAGRYGPLEEWTKKHPGKHYSRCTVPMKEPYQAWLREQITPIPSEQNIYEMGNEVWSYMSGKEFAEWCQMSLEVIKQVHPNAKVGADPGVGLPKFARPFFDGGGMNGMEIIYTHPYCFTPLPEWRVRPLMRNLQDMVGAVNGGKTLDIYVTEYGWPTAAKDTRKHSVSETVQAERTVRQSLMMYAEGVKALIPHWMADREQDIAERENWFGFFRLSGQPKPVVIAHANCARMIDGGRFVGDMNYGTGIGAMLFEKDGKHILALWTAEEPREATIDLGVPEVTSIDLMGREASAKTDNGKLAMKLGPSVVYLVGAFPTLAAKASPPTAELNPELWATRAPAVTAHRADKINVDGDLAEWKGDWIDLPGNSDGTKAHASVRWDAANVYVAMRVTGKKAPAPGVLKIGLNSNPSRQENSPKWYDCEIVLTPLADLSTAKATVQSPPHAEKPYELTSGSAPDAPRFALRPAADGFTAEVAIPAALLKGIPQFQPQSRMACRFAYENKGVTLANGDAQCRFWPYLELAD